MQLFRYMVVGLSIANVVNAHGQLASGEDTGAIFLTIVLSCIFGAFFVWRIREADE